MDCEVAEEFNDRLSPHRLEANYMNSTSLKGFSTSGGFYETHLMYQIDMVTNLRKSKSNYKFSQKFVHLFVLWFKIDTLKKYFQRSPHSLRNPHGHSNVVYYGAKEHFLSSWNNIQESVWYLSKHFSGRWQETLGALNSFALRKNFVQKYEIFSLPLSP